MSFEYVVSILEKEKKDNLDYMNYLRNNKQVSHGILIDNISKKINELDLAIKLLKENKS